MSGMALVILFFFSLMAFWRNNAILFMITAAISLISAFYAPDIFSGGVTTSLSITIGLGMIAYGLLCAGLALRLIFWSDKDEVENDKEE